MDNFKDTAYRMYKDASILYDNFSWLNACYLSGYVVECYSKLLIDNAISRGVTLQENQAKGYGHNIKRMNSELINCSSISAHIPSKYIIDLKVECRNIYHDWHPVKKYNEDGGNWSTQSKATVYKSEIEGVFNLIKNMELDGVI